MTHCSPRGAFSFPQGEFEERNRRISLSSAKERDAAKVAANPLRRRADRRDLELVDVVLERSAVDKRSNRHPRQPVAKARRSESARNVEEGGRGGRELGAPEARPAGTGRPPDGGPELVCGHRPPVTRPARTRPDPSTSGPCLLRHSTGSAVPQPGGRGRERRKSGDRV